MALSNERCFDRLYVKIDELEAHIEQLEAELQCFWTGDVPEHANFSMILLAQWGRKRLAEINKKPKLFQAGEE